MRCNRSYHPQNLCRRYTNASLGNALVKISAICLRVSIACIHTCDHLYITCSQKWWYFNAICFVHGCILGTLAYSSAPQPHDWFRCCNDVQYWYIGNSHTSPNQDWLLHFQRLLLLSLCCFAENYNLLFMRADLLEILSAFEKVKK